MIAEEVFFLRSLDIVPYLRPMDHTNARTGMFNTLLYYIICI